MSRRRLLGTAGAAAAVTAVSACGEPPDPQEIRRGHVIGQVDEVPEGGGAVFSQSKLVVTQPEKGEYKAFSASCTHGGCTVQEVEDEVIRCLCHGSEFDITSGEPVTGPAQEPLEPFTVTIDGEDIILD
ncbi:Rieske (2Fe-2S) protein [Nocardiopsis alba]|uniref:Cytochrome bc1 complex Rieske iron-sulfur subunit n=2 Tax=Nocardiopsis alba TaxID=53437 RepID=A0A7K2IMY9_9ACTN|nr:MULTISPECIES: Rieske (2Fe-2S) protein [Nocardiopsis]AFR09481.1 tat (twin-arginine translocation) pathway signal sequence domain protein [Nocardiopsis alba ATCC BAA-2165]MEC3894652.1 Rieske (2Fe-2S) protein [Nocardiopsis sp. LDBS1602]MYR31134.1 Rieske 2Fe-2S domain-containing protein [Nocardiopsis alba]